MQSFNPRMCFISNTVIAVCSFFVSYDRPCTFNIYTYDSLQWALGGFKVIVFMTVLAL